MDIPNLLTRLQGAGLTQKKIGDAIGCSQATISDLLHGKIGRVRPAHKIVTGLEKLADEMGLRSEQKQNSPRRRITDKKDPRP